MQYIKVPATNSTNTDLKQLFRKQGLHENCCLWTSHQTKGRGQRRQIWVSEKGKNLTFSILLTNLGITPPLQFKLSALISLGLIEALDSFFKPFVFYIKWPNDILAGHQKICGILIENILTKKKIEHSVIGIGLNVNQTAFPDLPQANSLKNLFGKNIDLEKLLPQLVDIIEKKVYDGLHHSAGEIFELYERYLFKKGVASIFSFPAGKQESGVIKGLSPTGKLCVAFENGLQEFDLKEISMIY